MKAARHILFLAAWILLGVAVGCGGPGPTERQASPPERASTASSSPAVAAAPVPSAERSIALQEARSGEPASASSGSAVEFSDPPSRVVGAMLELAGPEKGERVYILGCGDGGIAVGAARDRGAQVVVIDPSPEAIALARESVRRSGVEKLVEFREENLREAKIGDAQVLLVFLAAGLQQTIEDKLQKDLLPGTRIVTWIPASIGLPGTDEEVGTLSMNKVPAISHPNSLAPFVPTPMAVVEKMLEMAKVTKDDVLYDLGCGDGRIPIEAAKRYGARAVGIDFDRRRIQEARSGAQRGGLEKLVEFRQQDILQADFSDATVVTLYLLPDSNNRLKQKLAALKRGSRIVSHTFSIDGWPPARTETVSLPQGGNHTILLWEVREDMTGEKAQ